VRAGDVVAIAWPKAAVLAQARRGERIPLLPIDAARTGGDGRFTIEADLSAVPARYRDHQGRVAIELVAADRQRELRWNFTAAPRATTDWRAAAGVTGSAPVVPDLVLDVARGRAWDRHDDPARWADRRGKVLGASRRAQAAAAPAQRRSRQVGTAVHTLQAGSDDKTAIDVGVEPMCLSALAGGSLKNRKEHFLNVYAWKFAKGTVWQRYSVEHTLGIGYQSGGSWSMSGTSTLSFGASAGQGRIVNSSVWNRVNYRDFYTYCGTGRYRRPVGYYDLLSNDWAYVYHARFRNCVTKLRGSRWVTSSAKNRTYRYGTDIGPIRVTAQSGYGSGTELRFNFRRKSRLCGNSRYGPASSSQVETRRGRRR